MTLLIGNQLRCLASLHKGEPHNITLSSGSVVNVTEVFFDENANSGIAFKLEEFGETKFDSNLKIFEDCFPLNEDTIEEWFDDEED